MSHKAGSIRNLEYSSEVTILVNHCVCACAWTTLCTHVGNCGKKSDFFSFHQNVISVSIQTRICKHLTEQEKPAIELARNEVQ